MKRIVIFLAITFFIMPSNADARLRPIQQQLISDEISSTIDRLKIVLKRLLRHVPDDAFLIAIYLEDVQAYLKSIEAYFKDIVESELYNAQAKQLAREGLVLLVK